MSHPYLDYASKEVAAAITVDLVVQHNGLATDSNARLDLVIPYISCALGPTQQLVLLDFGSKRADDLKQAVECDAGAKSAVEDLKAANTALWNAVGALKVDLGIDRH